MKLASIFQSVAILMIAFGISVSAYSQQTGDIAGGVSIRLGLYDGEITPNFGIGPRFQYNASDPIRLDGSFTFFFPKKFDIMGMSTTTSMWNLDMNVHFLYPMSDNLNLYPLAGLAIVGIGAKVEMLGLSNSNSKTYVGANFGGGIDLKLSDTFSLNSELKLQYFEEGGDLFFSAGIIKRF